MKGTDPLIRLIKDHEKVSEFLEDMREVMTFLHDKEAWRKLKPIEDFFQRNIVSHFKFEEKIVFPAILSKAATPEAIKLILELQKEHGMILTKLEEFQSIVSKSVIPFDEKTEAELNLVARKIIDILLMHASKEDDNMLPILEKNKQIFG
jgi:iron-sulfur cluster repair protein YtfE (RIC family)